MAEIGHKPKGLYIHIPFCVQRCSYCDFLTFADVGEKEIADYVDGVVRQLSAVGSDFAARIDSSQGNGEAGAFANRNGTAQAGNLAVDTVYLGGGSPSFIDGSHIVKIMEAVKNHFDVEENAEITIEANPESISQSKLDRYRQAGINRLSIGVQSTDNRLLKMLGRAHSREMFLEKYEMGRKAGFDNISLDLIFALPGQTLSIWKKSLKEVIGLEPEHISFYALQVEEGTGLKDLIENGELSPVDEETDRVMYHRALDLFKENGYLHYEISNAAKPGYHSRHNLKYWSMDEYIGIGLGAHSYYGGRRYENVNDLKTYIEAGLAGKTEAPAVTPEDFWTWKHKNTEADERAEYMFTGLRKVEGISSEDFEKRFGLGPEFVFKEAIEKNVKAGLLQFEKNHIKLTGRGMDLFNQVLVDFV